MAGYSPTVFLPIWLPHPDDFYTRHANDVELSGAGTNEAAIKVLNAVHSPEATDLITLFVPNGGTVWIISDAAAYGHAGVQAVVVELTPIDQSFMKTNLPGGIPPAGKWLFLGADPVFTATYIDEAIKALPDSVKQKVFDDDPNSNPLLTLDNNYSFLFSLGLIGCDLQAGTHFSQLTANSDGTYSVSLQVLDVNGAVMSPFPLLAALFQVNNDLVLHPLIDQAGLVPVDTEVHLQFRYWDVATTTLTSKGSWSFLANTTVEVIDAGVISDAVLATGTTGADGKVSFTLSPGFFTGNDLYFRLTVSQVIPVQFDRSETWNGTWGTKGFKSTDGQPGYYENFSGYSIGRPDTPVLFNVGTPVFLQLRYYHKDDKKQRPVAKGTEVRFKTRDSATGFDQRLDDLYADRDGEIWGTAFHLVGAGNNELEHYLGIEDPSIRLPQTWFASVAADSSLAPFVITTWTSSMDPANGFVESSFSEAAIGEPDKLKLKNILVDKSFNLQAAALFILKVIRDTHQWFYYLSNKNWGGVEGLFIYVNGIWPIGSSVTPPNLGILYDINHIWERSVIAHEYSHAVTWEYIPYSTAFGYEPSGLLWKSATGAYITNHSYNRITNGMTAFMDGWSLMVQLALDLILPWGTISPGVTKLKDSNGNPVGIDSAPLLGLVTEGCYSQSYWDYLHLDVGLPPTHDTDNADLSAVNPSLVDLTIQTKFQQAVWFPMVALAENNLWADPNQVTVADFLARVQSIMPPSDYSILLFQLQKWHLA